MIKSVVREYHWAATQIDALFIDDIDYHGLIYWYNDVNELHKQTTNK